jgi:hypothetical protein
MTLKVVANDIKCTNIGIEQLVTCDDEGFMAYCQRKYFGNGIFIVHVNVGFLFMKYE